MLLEVRIKKRLKGFSIDEDFKTDCSLGILGESGSGKTITLKCIAGIERPDEGRIVLNGRVLFDSDRNINALPGERKVGYMFQNYALFPNMTVSENIVAGIKSSKEERSRLLREALSFFDLVHIRDKYPNEVSGGEAQRCALARIVVRRPELILLDEPFSALDSFRRYSIEDGLFELLERLKIPVVMVSHDKDEIYRRCKAVCVLDKGRSLGVISVEELFESPRYLSEAKLMGIRNFFRVKRLSDATVEICGLGLTLACSLPCDFIGINQRDLSLTDSGGIPIGGRIYSITRDSTKDIICVDINGTKVFVDCYERDMELEEGTIRELYIREDKILYLKE